LASFCKIVLAVETALKAGCPPARTRKKWVRFVKQAPYCDWLRFVYFAFIPQPSSFSLPLIGFVSFVSVQVSGMFCKKGGERGVNRHFDGQQVAFHYNTNVLFAQWGHEANESRRNCPQDILL